MQETSIKNENKGEIVNLNAEWKKDLPSILTKEGTSEEIPMLPKSNANADTSANQIESYEPQRNFLERELSTSTSLINESLQLLHSQTRRVLIKDDPEVRQPTEYDVIQARENMNTMARLIQTKVNFIKALKK